MQLRADLALNAVIRSLGDVVMPAVDSANGPAREQLQVAIGLLSLLAARLPLEYDFDCDELRRLIEFAHALDSCAPDSGLGESARTAQLVLDRAQTTPHEIRAVIHTLREQTGAAVTATYPQADAAARAALGACVLAHADAQLVRERSWLAPQGWEARPETIPDIGDLLGVTATD